MNTPSKKDNLRKNDRKSKEQQLPNQLTHGKNEKLAKPYKN